MEETDAQPPAPPSAPQLLNPIAEGQRIASLDVLRGVAIFGIFTINMGGFAMPFGRGLDDPSLIGAPTAERMVAIGTKIFFELKFISLFSLLFGAGFIVIFWRARAAGRAFIPYYVRRLFVLAIFGLVHGLFFWYGDVLFTYALFGSFLLLAAWMPPRVLLALAGLLTLASLMLYLAHAILPFDPDPRPAMIEIASSRLEDEPPAASGLAAMLDSGFNAGHPRWIAAEITAYRDGPFADALAFRVASFIMILVAIVFSFGWRLLAMFFIGAALMKMHFFSPGRRRWQAALAAGGLALGLPPEIYVAWALDRSGYVFDLASIEGELLHELASLPLCLGYTGLVCFLVSARVAPPVQRAFAAVGRMALTNYLFQTLISTFLMYWWGLGLFNRFTRVEQVGLIVAIFAVQIVLSALWLRSFTMGPMEWLWRTLTYMRIQPIRRRPPTEPLATAPAGDAPQS